MFEYKVVEGASHELEILINDLALEGWVLQTHAQIMAGRGQVILSRKVKKTVH